MWGKNVNLRADPAQRTAVQFLFVNYNILLILLKAIACGVGYMVQKLAKSIDKEWVKTHP
jgi:hypothetical protein